MEKILLYLKRNLRFRYAIGLLIALTFFVNHASAQYAVGGTAGDLAKSVYWLTWDDATLTEKPATFTSTNVVNGTYRWMFSPTVRITAIISNRTTNVGGNMVAYTPGQYSGDGLDLIYSGNGLAKPNSRGVVNSGLATTAGATIKFDIDVKVDILINGVWTNITYPGMVIADAESIDASGEYIQGTSPSSIAWQLLNKRTNGNANDDHYRMLLSNAGKKFKLSANLQPGNFGIQAVMFAHNASNLLDVEMKGSGITAMAIGFVLPFDLGDAPISYGDKVGHYIDKFLITDYFPGDGDYATVNYPTTPLTPQATVYIGLPNVDADGLGAHGPLANADNNTQNNDENTIDASALADVKVNQAGDYVINFPVTNTKNVPAVVRGWVDFNGDGIFSPNEMISVTVPANASNYTVTLTYPNASFINEIKTGSLYARIRITTSNLIDDPATAVDERSTSFAADGETEDYRLKDIIGPSISGNVINDGNGMSDNQISGNGISTLSGSPLYAYLSDNTNKIIAKTPVSANGSYEFANLNKGTYSVAISTVNVPVNGTNTLANIPPTIPAGWSAVGDAFGINNSQTGFETGVPDMRVKVVIPGQSMDVTAVNFAVDQVPVAVNDDVSTTIDTDLIIDVLANDTDPNGNATINKTTVLLFNPTINTYVTSLTVTNQGVYTVDQATGKVTFNPEPAFIGIATPVKYTVQDNAGVVSNQAEITVRIKPVGVNDASLTALNTPVTTVVKSNDGVSASGTTVSKVANPTHGSVVVNGDGTITYTPTNGYIGTDTYTYKLTTADLVDSDPITVTITIGTNPKISLVKSITNTGSGAGGTFKLGDVINYSFKVKNEGDVILNTIVLAESLPFVTLTGPTGDTGNDQLVSVNEVWTYLGTYTVTQANVDAGKVTNQATVTAKDPINTPVSDISGSNALNDTPTETNITQTPVIRLIKTGTYADTNGDGKVNLGDKISYTFKVENTGNVTVSDILITDPRVTVTGGPVTLLPGAVDLNTFTASYTVTQADIDKGAVYNIATATGTDPKGNNVTDQSESGNPSGPGMPPVDPACPDCTITPLPQSPVIRLTKTGTYADTNGDGKVNLGDKISYTFKVENTGNVTVSGIIITDPKVTVTGGPVTLLPGAVDLNTFTASYTVTQADIDKGAVYNIATATGTDPKGNTVTDQSESGNPSGPGAPPVDPACPDCTITPLPQSPVIRLTKTGTYADTNGDGKVNLGDKITYTFKVENTGNVTVSGIVITDPKVTVTGGPVTLLPGAADLSSFTASYIVTQADIDKGAVYNIATATGKDPKGNNVTDQSESGNPSGPGTPPVDPACPDCTITPLPQTPVIRLIKTGTYADTNGDGKVNLGDKISYTFKVENTGNVTVSDILITDPKVTVTGGPVTLLPGAVDLNTFTASYTVTQADIDKGAVYNIATATGTDPKGNDVTDESESGNPTGPGTPPVDPACPDCTITPLPQNPVIRLTKTGTYADTNGDGKVNLGDKISYTFKVENTGNVTVSNVVITDPKVTVVGGPVTLLPGAADLTTFTASYTVTQADIDKGAVYNIATATGTDPKGNNVTDQSESGNPSGPGTPPVDPACPDCTITLLPQNPVIRLTKTGTYADTNGDGKVNLGDKISYTFKVENTGNVTVSNIVVTDPKVTVTGGPVTLLPGAADLNTFTASYTVTQADIDKGAVYNIATATGKDPKGNNVTDESESGNPSGPGTPPVDPACPDCTITPLPQSPVIKLTKTGTYADTNGDGKVNLGDKISYTFKVENTGNVTVSGIIITDPKVTIIGGPVTLLPGAADLTTFTASYTVTQADIDKGAVYNIATATGKDPKGNNVTDESESGNPSGPGTPPVDPACPDCTITPLPQSPVIRLTKTGTYADTNGDGKVNLGDKISYTFKVENTGNVTVSDIVITDPKVTVVGGPVTLLPGAVDLNTFTASYIVTQADIDKGAVYNLATATGTDPKGNTVTDQSENGNPSGPGTPLVDPACPDCTVTPLPQTPVIRLTKTGTYADTNGDGKVNLGDKISYTFKIENTGNVTVSDIVITDPKVTVVGGPVTLLPGAADLTTFTASYTVTQADIDKGAVYNIATATGTDPKGNNVTDESETGNPSGPGTPPVDPTCPDCTITPLPQTPVIRLTKTGTYADTNGDGKVNLGDKISYTFKVENTGNVTVSGIIITDPKVTVNGGPVTLLPGAVDLNTFTASYTVTQADIDKGAVYNIATATGTDPKGNTVTDQSESGNPSGPGTPPVDPACPDCTITPLPQTPVIRLTKTGTYADTNGDGKVNLGDKISYTFKVENTGNVTVSGIIITDPKVTVNGGPVTLLPGAVDLNTFTASYTVTQADIDKGAVYNIATATGTDPKGNTVTDQSESGNPSGPGTPPVDPACPDCTITPLPQSPVIRLTKTGTYADTNGDGKVNLGDKISYTFKVENTGNVTVSGIVITDPKVTVTGGPVTLLPGAADLNTFTASYTVTQADIDKGAVYNIATATGTDPKGNTVTDQSENGNPSGPGTPPVDPACPDCTITPLPQSPVIKLTKTGTYADSNGDGKVNLGDKISYTFKVENTGNVTVSNIVVTDPKVTVTGGPVTLLPGAVDLNTFTASYTVTQADIDKGAVYNIATATGKDPKGNTVTDESESGNPSGPGTPPVDPACPDCTITPLPQTPVIRLTKTGTYADTNGDGKVNLGDKISYTFKVENTGNVTVSDIVITDPKVTVTGGPVTLLPGAVDLNTFTASYTVTQADIDKGTVYNIATATGTDPKGNTVTDQSESGNPSGPGTPPVDPACPDCTITPLPQSPVIRLTKTGTYADTNSDGKVNLGDKISYTFKVENTGNVTVSNIVVTDPKVTVTGGPVTLLPGAVDLNTFTASYTVTQSDIDKGAVYNIATATGTDPKGNTVTDQSENGNPSGPGTPPVDPACPDCTITPLPQTPVIKLTKTGTYADTNGDGKVNLGDKISYTFKVENTGNVTVSDIVITDPKVTVTGGPVTLLPGAADLNTFTASYIVTQADIDKGAVYNIATATGKDPKGNNVTDESESGNPSGPGTPPVDPACPDCTITPLPQTGALVLVKKVTNVGTGVQGAFVLNNDIEYTFTITNTGNTTLSNIVLNDPLIFAGTKVISGILAPGTSLTHKETYKITAADIDNGKVTNTAVATAKDPKGNDVKDTSGTDTDNDQATETTLAKPPVAKDDAGKTQQNKPVTVNVQSNDLPGSKPFVPASTTVVTRPAHGTVKVNTDGTVNYTPDNGYTGTDTFTYTVIDENGQVSNAATVTITVIPSKPVAGDDHAETEYNKPVSIPVLANDSIDGSPFDKSTVEIISSPAHGRLVVNADGTVIYTPYSGYTGKDQFTYRVKDENGNWTNVATATINVTGFFIPNVFTPNGDGKNDLFVIVGIENYQQVEITIFNRWGNEVYRNSNYKNTWDGQGLTEGTYYYMITLRNGSDKQIKKGWVLIKK